MRVLRLGFAVLPVLWLDCSVVWGRAIATLRYRQSPAPRASCTRRAPWPRSPGSGPVRGARKVPRGRRAGGAERSRCAGSGRAQRLRLCGPVPAVPSRGKPRRFGLTDVAASQLTCSPRRVPARHWLRDAVLAGRCFVRSHVQERERGCGCRPGAAAAPSSSSPRGILPSAPLSFKLRRPGCCPCPGGTACPSLPPLGV